MTSDSSDPIKILDKSPIPCWTLQDDLDYVVEACDTIWPSLAQSHLLITGGTGFIGCWLLETLRAANLKLELNIKATVLTRHPELFALKAKHLATCPFFTFIRGEISSFKINHQQFTHLIHAAASASAQLNEDNPLTMLDTIVKGTRYVLDFAVQQGIGRLLYLSSGAVYGPQVFNCQQVSETYEGAPACLDVRATYGQAKRTAELLCAIYAKQFGLEIAIARIFALLGPYLPLDIHFAAGNFIHDAIAGRCVQVNGDGKAYRSYLYAADLSIMLWHMLVQAKSLEPYHLGSEHSISLAKLAQLTSTLVGTGEFEILGASVGPDWNPGRYVPCTAKIRKAFKLDQMVSLEDAILRTALWYGWKK